MTLRLILTRHAKSSWDNQGLRDHDRPLSKRGRASAKAIGRWMARHEYVPDQVLCSTAERTRATWALVADNMLVPPRASYLGELYLADPAQMLACLQKAQEETVMMLGHNPGSADMAQSLITDPPAHPRFGHYPTAATTVIDFDTDNWAGLNWRQGRVVDFMVPRDLI